MYQLIDRHFRGVYSISKKRIWKLFAYWSDLLTWWHRNSTIAGSTFASWSSWVANWIVWCIVWWNLWWNHSWWCSIFTTTLSKCSGISSFHLQCTSAQLRWCWWFCRWWRSNSIWLNGHLIGKQKRKTQITYWNILILIYKWKIW